MPAVPEPQRERDSELLQKPKWNRGVLENKKPFIPKRPFKIPKKLVKILLAVIVVLVGIYFVTATFFPKVLEIGKKASAPKPAAFEYPFNVVDVKYPSDFLKEKFLANFQAAAGEQDADKRYKYLEDNFTMLRGFYTATSSYDTRLQLQNFRVYMQNRYSDKTSANRALYEFPCIDKLCSGSAKIPDEIAKIRDDLSHNDKINVQIKEAILRNFDSASLSTDKVFEANMYMGALSMVVSEFTRTSDAGIKDAYAGLYDYIAKNYPNVVIPQELRI